MTKQYYRGAKACVLAFSTTDRASFEAIEEWNEKVLRECDENICRVLIQNKIDLLHERVVEEQEAEQLATKLNVKFYRMSVKNNFNVGNVFTHLAVQYMKQKQQQQIQQKQSEPSQQQKKKQTSEDDFTDRPFNLEKATKRVEQNKDEKKKRNCC
jgi:Ras-related protein Rab-23